ncbi:type II toxin-antitoxin system PemK/MazF family toxin [Aneurinibacillus thermoaerophilus]|uniref:type II toxin-antitoxin system PemK/MazF family toxin n=1 Tax=Aneurinibacillus thermoaerophilus TaxID=143495 RepID=UPI002E1ED2CA|nr:type II toxin-antitoxin system PemK/MazF family toxin [Aneurinibacillus thermoaerophilus]
MKIEKKATFYYQKKNHLVVKRGELWLANVMGLDPFNRKETILLILQNDIGNRFSPTTIAVLSATDDQEDGRFIETIYHKTSDGYSIIRLDVCLLTTVDKRGRLIERLGRVNDWSLEYIERKYSGLLKGA